MGDILRRCQGEGRPYLPVRPEPSTTKSARELGGRTDGRTDAGPASPPPGLAAAAASRAGPRCAPPPGGMSYKPNLTAHMPAASLNAGECAPRAARAAPQVPPSWGPARPGTVPGGPREAGGGGDRVPARGSAAAAAAMIPAPALPKLAGAPRAGLGLGPGPGWGAGRGRPPRFPPTPAAEGSRGAWRVRAGDASSAPFSSSFWAARRGPLPAGVGSGRAAAGAGRGARAAGGERGCRPGPGGPAAEAHVCGARPSWGRAGGGGVPGAAAQEVAGRPGRVGVPRGAGDSMNGGLSLARASRVLGAGHVGGPLSARCEGSWRGAGDSECSQGVCWGRVGWNGGGRVLGAGLHISGTPKSGPRRPPSSSRLGPPSPLPSPPRGCSRRSPETPPEVVRQLEVRPGPRPRGPRRQGL